MSPESVNECPQLQVNMLVIISTAAIIGGCLLLVLFGNHDSKEYTVDDLLELYRQ